MGDFLPTETTIKQKKSLTALTRDELSQAYEDKKWIAIRYMFFICFVVAWVAIFVNVVIIIVEVSNCKPEPVPMWYQDNVVYKINAQEFAGNLNGIKNHLKYIDNIQAKTILVCGMSESNDPISVVENQEDAFDNLVKAIHKTKGRKIIVDIVVDSLSIKNKKFLESASTSCADNSNGLYCDMFVWERRDEAVNSSELEWTFNSTRNQSYQVVQRNPTQAMLNYGSNLTLPFVTELLNSWLTRGIDGVLVRDISKLHNITQKEFTEALWKIQHFNDAKNLTMALFVSSSTPQSNISSVPLKKNQSNTIHSPVFFTTDISRSVGEVGAGKMIEEMINKWRTETHFMSGFEISPIDEPLAAVRFPDYAAGLILLSLALPGVPVLRSGDELLARSGVFAWKADAPDSASMNGSNEFLKEIKRLITLRIAGILSKLSLRFDTKDEDTLCFFLDLGNSDVLAFKRKWTTRDSVLVVSNMSPNRHTVSLMQNGGLMKDEAMVEKAKVLASSIPSSVAKGDVILLNSVIMESGTTLVMEAE